MNKLELLLRDIFGIEGIDATQLILNTSTDVEDSPKLSEPYAIAKLFICAYMIGKAEGMREGKIGAIRMANLLNPELKDI